MTAGTYGPAANETLDFGDSVTIPSLQVDTYGRIIVANARTITLPADSNTDTTVVQSASTSNANYPVLLCPTSNASTDQGAKQAIFTNKIMVNPSTGAITATSFIGNISGASDTADTLTTARLIDGVSFNGGSNIVHYGTCSTAAATAEKAVSVTGFTLETGAEVCVKFTVTNTASPVTLNVNSTGAKQIQYRGTAISAANIAANRVYRFVYDGTYYQLQGDINTDTTVTQNVSTASGLYPILCRNVTGTSTGTGGATFDSYVKAHHGYGIIEARQVFCYTQSVSASTITVYEGACFTKTIEEDTTLVFDGVLTSRSATFSLVLTNGGAYTVTWPSSVKWAGGTIPSLTASGIDIITFLTVDGGTTWYGVPSVLDAK